MPLLRRRQTEIDTKEAEKELLKPVKRERPISFTKVLSTGSTLLDLAISGKRCPEGGVPAGIYVEIFGPSGVGKTALLAELGASAQARGGEVTFDDPEARLDKEYATIYGLNIEESSHYHRSDTVSQMFELLWNWETNEDYISLFAADSIAALSTKMELEDGDKYGMRRAKEFSEGLRKTCRLISNNSKLVAFTNQVRDKVDAVAFGPKEVTPGGRAVEYYASLRLRIGFDMNSKIKKEVTFKEGKKLSKVIGIRSKVTVVKSTIDEPFREAPVSIVFGYGIDSIRDELIYLKENLGTKDYPVFSGEQRGVTFIDNAIKEIEKDKNLRDSLKKKVIDLWNEIDEKFRVERKPKER